MSNPLFLNLAVAGRLRPGQLLECDEEQELRDLVLDSYINRTLADQRRYESEDASRYLAWIARFLNGDEVSPFGLKTTDYTVFDLADLTPPKPPRRYLLFGTLVAGMVLTLVAGMVVGLAAGLAAGLVGGLTYGLIWGLLFGLALALAEWAFKRSAVSSRLTLVWPSTRRQLLDFLRRAGRGLTWGLGFGLAFTLVFALIVGLTELVFALFVLPRGIERGAGDLPVGSLLVGLLFGGLVLGLGFGLVLGLGFGLLQPRSVLITSRTPKEARSRSVIAALTWLISGLVGGLLFGLVVGLVAGLVLALVVGLVVGLFFGLAAGLVLALLNGGWFVILQKVAHRRLARDGNLPRRLYDFLDWGVDTQVFRRVGGGVRFRHNLIQQHLASTAADAGK